MATNGRSSNVCGASTFSMPSKCKLKMNALKVKIKQWEMTFVDENGRKPSKDDIRQTAPAEIKKSYKTYWSLLQNETNSRLNEIPVAKDTTWSVKLNKNVQHKSECKSNTYSHQTNLKNGKHCSGGVQTYVDKLRNKVLLFSKPYVKLPVPEQCQGEVTPAKGNKVEGQSQEGSNELPDNATTNTNKIIISGELSETCNVECKARSFDLQVRETGLKNSRKVFGTMCSLRNNISSINCAKVDLNWLSRCSLDSPSDKVVNHEIIKSNLVLRESHKESVPRKIQVDIADENNDYVLQANDKDMHSSDVLKRIECVAVNDEQVVTYDQLGNAEVGDSRTNLSPPTDNSKKRKRSLNDEQLKSKNPCLAVDSFIECRNSSDIVDIPPATEAVGDRYEFVDDMERNLSHNVNAMNSKRSRFGKLKGSNELFANDSPVSKKMPKKYHENFVKLNLKKKVFVRGKRNFSYRKFKRNKWKKYQMQKQKEEENNLSDSSMQLQHRLERKEVRDSVDAEDLIEVNDVLPTMSEVETPTNTVVSINTSSVRNCKPVESLYTVSSDGNVIATPKRVFDGLKKLGFTSFRPGQEKAIMRILSGLSTLVILPTGSGKSLCYQLPAYLYSQECCCVTLVISPLVSLMEDQVTNIPSCLNAACWHSNMTDVQKKETLEKLLSGSINILLVSPETLVSGSGYLFGKLPPIAFVCIDEVHCISEWSHNFRPSYLQLIKVLTVKMGISRILALTATASNVTANSIASHLCLVDDEGAVIDKTDIPDNLFLSVSMDEFRDEALIGLLRVGRFKECNSIIIYCTRREETERVATCIRIHMHEDYATPAEASKGVKKFKWLVEAYHSGLTPAKRKSVQKRFMNGTLRIVVATVAFGMGLNKTDVRAVIHYNMPKTFEHYVQEIGRAGRDGQPAHCHLFLTADGRDLPELRRHIYANTVDRHVISKLLSDVFTPCRCTGLDFGSVACPGHEISVSVESLVQKLDLKEENIATLFCYLEQLPEKFIEFLPLIYSLCTIKCYRGQEQLLEMMKCCPPVAVAFGLLRKSGKRMEKQGQLQFDVVRVASHMGWDSAVVKKQLKNLEWTCVAGRWKKSGVMVEFSDLAFHAIVKGTLSNDQKDSLLDYLYVKMASAEKRELNRLKEVESTFQKASHPSYETCCDDVDLDRCRALKKDLVDYYTRPISDCLADDLRDNEISSNADEVASARRDIRAMLDIYHDNNLTGRAIARIFHGIGSPCYPVEVWGRVRRFWRSHMHVDFNFLIGVANQEIRKVL